MPIVKCEQCGKEHYQKPSRIKLYKKSFCCKSCQYKHMIKEPNKIETKNNHAEIIIISEKYGEIRAKIDIEDISIVKDFRWFIKFEPLIKSFYVHSGKNVTHKKVLLHRLITKCPDGLVVDHINHDALDNRKQNLKVCTHAENMCNISKNKYGCTGISYDKRALKNCWRAVIIVNKKHISLGCYEKLEDAIKARKDYENKLRQEGIYYANT